MGEQQYIAHSLTDTGSLAASHSLREVVDSSAAQSGSFYTVPTPFSAVSSFNIPTQCDPSLLTPISSSASPPLPHISKLGNQYPPPPLSPLQAQTPPDTSSMYSSNWNDSFDMNTQGSQASSPLNNSAQVQPEFIQSFMPRRGSPLPPEPYLGHYGVSSGPPSHQIDPYYMNIPPMVSATHGLISSSVAGDSHASRPLPSTAPLLHQPQPTHFRQQRRISGQENVFAQLPGPSVRPSTLTRSPRRTSLPGTTRAKKRVARRQSSLDKGQSLVAGVPKSDLNCRGEQEPPRLKNTCSQIDRLINDSRWRHRHQKGQHMWELIKKDVDKATGKIHGKEDLQMKFRRSRAHIEWLPEDIELLKDAFMKLEKDRYQIMLNFFKEMGGSQNMVLNRVDVEAKVVELRLEQGLYMEGPNGFPTTTRRRRKIPSKKRNVVDTPDDNSKEASELRDLMPTQEGKARRKGKARSGSSDQSDVVIKQEDIYDQIDSARPRAWAQGLSDDDDIDMKGLGVNGLHQM